MKQRPRLYDTLLADHLATVRQMAFVSGPRQVGKTTTCRALADSSANWDNLDDRKLILAGPASIAEHLRLDALVAQTPVALFDELHKYRQWKRFLKGFYDTYGNDVRVLVTGSGRLDVYRRGGDSLMGRYFTYRMHPFSLAEVLHQTLPDAKRLVRAPSRIKSSEFDALLEHGGYPEPFLRRDARFSNRWQVMRVDQLLRGDVRDSTQIQQFDQMEILARLLNDRSSCQLVYSNLASQVRISTDTAQRWVGVLCSLHHGFLLRPWFRNVSRSLRKEPRWFLRDWTGIEDPGRKAETFIACHLLKAVEGWSDMGFGKFQLGYLRDKQQREVDFVVVRDGKPWFLVEVKQSESAIGSSLAYFQKQIKAPYAFQVVLNADFVDADCFARPRDPLAVPALTFLSQLL